MKYMKKSPPDFRVLKVADFYILFLLYWSSENPLLVLSGPESGNHGSEK
jgi:hypothetical protein